MTELSLDLHDLYHDVLHGPESRPLSSALNDAVKAKHTSESMLIRIGESDRLADGVNNVANELDTRGDSDLLADCVNKDPNRDVCMNKFMGSGENNLPENFAEQLKEDVTVETTQTHSCGRSMEVEDVEKLNVEEIPKPEVDSEGLAGKEGGTNALPESQGPEDYIRNSIITRETEANEQAEQVIGLDREVDGTGQAQKGILASSLSENVVGVVGADVGDECVAMAVQKDVAGVVGANVEERAMAVQQDTESSEEKQQLSFGVQKQDAQEGEVIVLSNEADFKALDIPSEGKDATEVPMSDGKDASEVPIVPVVDIDKRNVEGSDKLPTSNVSEEETNLCKDDEVSISFDLVWALLIFFFTPTLDCQSSCFALHISVNW